MASFEKLKTLSEESLKENLILTSRGVLCVAGAHQYKTLWTRDFCYAVPGLLKSGSAEVVKRQLDLIASFLNEDGCLPRGLDVVSPKTRVVNAIFGEPFSNTTRFDYVNRPLRAEYLGEHGTPAFDSNVLWLRAAFSYAAFTGDTPWILSHKKTIASLFGFYLRQPHEDGLWRQPKFSDWMDSLRRTGSQLAFHLLLWRVVKMADALQVATDFQSASLLDAIERHWFNANNEWQKESTDALLLCLEHNIGQHELLLAEIKSRPIGVPDLKQPVSEVSWTTRLVGLRHYHDGFAWTWLAAETARVVRRFDERFADAILEELEALAVKNKTVPEIYFPGTDQMVKTLMYLSERPFSWGAAKILEAL